MTLNYSGCKNLASAVLLEAMEDYGNPSRRPEVQAFLFSENFYLFTELAGWNPGRIRREIMGKDCRTCKNRYREQLCVQCYETDPTKTHNYYVFDDRKGKKELRRK